MASDRRFGLPHPFDSDPSGDSSAGRKPGLWETLKRALAAPQAVEQSAAVLREEPRVPAAATPPRPAPAAEPAAKPALLEVAAGVPFLDDLPVASPPPVAALPAAPDTTLDPSPPAEIALAGMPESAPAAPHLARGLASFSRDNAEREKKFAHLLRDSASRGGRRPPGSRKRS